jgi:hypothetical protein
MADTPEVGKKSDRTSSHSTAMDISLDHGSSRLLQKSVSESQSSRSTPEFLQRIFYEAFDMTELSDIVKQPGKTGEELAALTKVIEHKLRHR